MKKNIYTLVAARVCPSQTAPDTSVQHSFYTIDQDAKDAILKRITEDCEDFYDEEDIKNGLTPAFHQLVEKHRNAEFTESFPASGEILWQYTDDIETFQYTLHCSVIEMPDMSARDYRKTLTSQIQGLLKKGFEADFTEYNDCPVVQQGDNDCDTYTLDRIYIQNGVLRYDASSAYSDMSGDVEDIDADTLEEILEILTKYGSEVITELFPFHDFFGDGVSAITREDMQDKTGFLPSWVFISEDNDCSMLLHLQSITKDENGIISFVWKGEEGQLEETLEEMVEDNKNRSDYVYDWLYEHYNK